MVFLGAIVKEICGFKGRPEKNVLVKLRLKSTAQVIYMVEFAVLLLRSSFPLFIPFLWLKKRPDKIVLVKLQLRSTALAICVAEFAVLLL